MLHTPLQDNLPEKKKEKEKMGLARRLCRKKSGDNSTRRSPAWSANKKKRDRCQGRELIAHMKYPSEGKGKKTSTLKGHRKFGGSPLHRRGKRRNRDRYREWASSFPDEEERRKKREAMFYLVKNEEREFYNRAEIRRRAGKDGLRSLAFVAVS